jgi:hypothetical protein
MQRAHKQQQAKDGWQGPHTDILGGAHLLQLTSS